jgi:putative RNA 2'-phosphotransferase
LSGDVETASAVGSRHGKPVILTIDAKAEQAAGFKFNLSAKNVWHKEEVPVQFI